MPRENGRRSLPEELRRYRVAAKVRKLRLRKKISLEELGRHTGLSPALLSKLEREQVMPTLTTLNRIALVFGVGLDSFFTRDDPGATVIRAADRLRFPELQDDDRSAYDFESLDYLAGHREMNTYRAEFRPASGALRSHAHEAAELLFVVSGELLVRVDGIDHLLSAGDSIY